jgi:SAM-dependent methyltransferase
MSTYLDRMPRSVLDYGCGSGRFLALTSQLALLAQGVDVSPRAVERATSNGLVCSVGSYEDMPPGLGQFDLVRVWHVLEHTPDPVAALRALRDYVADGGRLAVAVPNSASAPSVLFGSDWFQLDVPRHVWSFNPDNLRLTLETAGFGVERMVFNGTGTEAFYSVHYALRSRYPEADTAISPEAAEGMSELARVWNDAGVGDSMVAVGVKRV